MGQAQTKDKAIIIAAIITGVFGCVAAAIGLGSPIVENLANRYIPTFTPAPSNPIGIESDNPTSTLKVNSNTEIPAMTPKVFVTQSTVQTFSFSGQCSSVPANPTDNLQLQLDPSRWYLLEEYDNQANPPIHIFRAQIGNISVSANAVRGIRAWECRGEAEAISQAQLNAISYKKTNPSHKVIGPDGQEVK